MTFYVSKKLVSVYIAFLFLPFFSLLVIDFTSPTISYSLFHSFLFFLISSFYSLIFVPFRSLSRFNFNLTSVACPAIKILSFLGLFLFIINILITISSFEYIQINDIDITTLKNTGIANDVIKSSYNPVLVFLVRLFSPLSFIILYYY